MTTLRFLVEVTTDDRWEAVMAQSIVTADMLDYLRMMGPELEPLWVETFDSVQMVEPVPGHGQFAEPPAISDGRGGWDYSCSAHSEGMDCCADNPRVFRTVEP